MNNVKAIQRLNEAEARLGVKDKLSWHAQYKDSAYVFVGGLDYKLTEGDVLAVFSQYGEIVNINLVRDKKSGKSKGFCFLAYQDQRSTVLAVDNFNGIKVCGRTIRVDHVRQYRRPKDENGEEIIEKGCAPKTPSPSPVSSPAASPSPPPLAPKKKTKKKKKDKSKEKGATLEDRDVKEEEPQQHSLRGGSVERKGADKACPPEWDKETKRKSLHHNSREDRWERPHRELRRSPVEKHYREAESRRGVNDDRKIGVRMEDRKRGYRHRGDSDSSGSDEEVERRESQYRQERKARYVAEPTRYRSRSPDQPPPKDRYRHHRSSRH